MSSLTDLNTESNKKILVFSTDNQPFEIEYASPTSSNQSVNLTEGDSHTIPFGNDVTRLKFSNTNFTLTVTLPPGSQSDGAAVSLPGAYAGPDQMAFGLLTITNPAPDVYSVNNILTISVWNHVRDNLTLTAPRDGLQMIYQVALAHDTYGSASGTSWQVTANYANLDEITVPTPTTYVEDTPTLILGYPQILDLENPSTDIYTITVYPDNLAAVEQLVIAAPVPALTTNDWNPVTKELVLTGSKTNVNTALTQLTLIPALDSFVSFNLFYKLVNPASSLETIVSQGLSSSDVPDDILNILPDRAFTQDHVNTLFTAPVPVLSSAISYPSYTFSLTVTNPANTSTVVKEVIAQENSMVGWDEGTYTFTYTGTESQCNSMLASLKFAPAPATTQTYIIRYQQWALSDFGLIQQVDQNFNVVGSEFIGAIGGEGLYSQIAPVFSSMPSYQGLDITNNTNRYLKCRVLVIGPGGNGGAAFNNFDAWSRERWGGCGGGGEVVSVDDWDYFKNLTSLAAGAPKTINIHPGTGVLDSSIAGWTEYAKLVNRTSKIYANAFNYGSTDWLLSAVRGGNGGDSDLRINRFTFELNGFDGANGGGAAMSRWDGSGSGGTITDPDFIPDPGSGTVCFDGGTNTLMGGTYGVNSYRIGGLSSGCANRTSDITGTTVEYARGCNITVNGSMVVTGTRGTTPGSGGLGLVYWSPFGGPIGGSAGACEASAASAADNRTGSHGAIYVLFERY